MVDSSKQSDLNEDERKNQLIAEILIRISSLEAILIAKNLLTKEELASSLLEVTSNLLKHYNIISQNKV